MPENEDDHLALINEEVRKHKEGLIFTPISIHLAIARFIIYGALLKQFDQDLGYWTKVAERMHVETMDPNEQAN